jgi:hypothetical protein
MAGALLEDRLMHAIQAQFLQDKAAFNALFGGMGPLATFSAKIELAYLMKLIAKESRTWLNTVRRIRNEFAHNLDPIDFTSQKIRDLCSNLASSEIISVLKAHFMDSVGADETVAKLITEWLDPMIALSDGPRTRYMNTIKMEMFILELRTSLANTADGEEISVRLIWPSGKNTDRASSEHES